MTDLEFTPIELELRWLAMPPDAHCSICGKTFSYPEWLDRHTDSHGKDCHDECCDVCGDFDEDATD
jgi:hypothetical protein